MNLDTLNRGELLIELMELAREEGIATQEAWNGLCDEVVESHLDLDELNDDNNTEGLKQALYLGFAEYKAEAGEETIEAGSEDPEAPHA